MTDGVGALNGSVHSRDCRIDVAEQPETPTTSAPGRPRRHPGRPHAPPACPPRCSRRTLRTARSITSRAPVRCPMKRRIIACPRIALSNAGRSPRASASWSRAAIVSSASGNSPRITLAVVSQNITWRYSGGSPSRSHSSRARAKVAIVLFEAGPCVAIRQGPRANWKSSSNLSLRALSGRWPESLDTSLQVRDGFEVGRAHGGLLAGLQPICHRLFEQPGLRQMVRERFGLSLHDFREPLLEGVRDRGVQRARRLFRSPE